MQQYDFFYLSRYHVHQNTHWNQTGENKKNNIQPNNRTYPYKRTIKQFRSLQITTRLFLSTSL